MTEVANNTSISRRDIDVHSKSKDFLVLKASSKNFEHFDNSEGFTKSNKSHFKQKNILTVIIHAFLYKNNFIRSRVSDFAQK